jgi:hypothetical protein
MGINALADFERVAEWIEVDFFLVAMPYTLLDQAALHGPDGGARARGQGGDRGALRLGAADGPLGAGAHVQLWARAGRGRARALAIEGVVP